MPEYLTREQISEKLDQEGFDVSVRTLRFWEAEDMLPSANLIEGRALHNIDVLSAARALAATRPKLLSEFRKNGAKQVRVLKATEDELILQVSYRKKEKIND